MGSYLSKQKEPVVKEKESEERGIKRKHPEESSDEEECDKIDDTILNTPKK